MPDFGPAKSIGELPKTANGEVLFYWLDAQDDQRGAPGVIYMFGKGKQTDHVSSYESAF